MVDIQPLSVTILENAKNFYPNDFNPGDVLLNDVRPVYDHEGDSGMRLYVLEDTYLYPFVFTTIDHGIAIQGPPGYETQIRPRSSSASKKSSLVVYATIDQSYTGEISSKVMYTPAPKNVTIANHRYHGEPHYEDVLVFPAEPYLVKKGERVSQLVLARVADADVRIVPALTATSRGLAGWGSTGG